jgi:multiple sugar transport system ATP-binding protein
VFQSFALFPHLNVADNIGFGLAVRRVPQSERRSRVAAAAEVVGCADLLERRPLELSGGERQRVALARAIAREPEVFLLDEPLSSLDAHLRVRMRTELRELQRRLSATMVYVTHDQVEALTLGDRVAVLDAGRIQQVGPPDEIYGAPANRFVAQFIGSPAMNLFPAAVEGRSLRAGPFLVRRQGLGELRGRALQAGVRPEDVRLGGAARTGIPALVRLVEVAGHETFVHLEAAGIRLVARGEASLRPGAGSTVRVSLEAARVHLFDADSGDAIR